MTRLLRVSLMLLAASFGVAGLSGCGAAPAPSDSAAVAEDHDHDHAHDADHDHDHEHGEGEAHAEGEDGEDHGHHHHTAPHGGALVSLGDHVGHLEFVLDSSTGLLTAYVLDGEAENPVRIPDASFDVAIDVEGGAPFVATLNAVANALAGETVGDTSEFNATLEGLVGVESFKGVVASVSFKGVAMTNVAFAYPEGEQ